MIRGHLPKLVGVSLALGLVACSGSSSGTSGSGCAGDRLRALHFLEEIQTASGVPDTAVPSEEQAPSILATAKNHAPDGVAHRDSVAWATLVYGNAKCFAPSTVRIANGFLQLGN